MDKLKDIDEKIKKFLENPNGEDIHPSDLVLYLKKIKDKKEFIKTAKAIPMELLGEVILELPENLAEDLISSLPKQDLAEATSELESDDATDLIQEIEEVDSLKSQQVISELNKEDRDEINTLRAYDEDQAGSIMQTELFYAIEEETIQTAISRLAKLKAEEKVQNIFQVFIIDKDDVLKGAVALHDLITLDNFNDNFSKVLKSKTYIHKKTFLDLAPITEVVKAFEKYNLTYAPVVNSRGMLVGRITSDDIFDEIEDMATEQIYNLAGVDDEEEYGNQLFEVIRKRGMWLLLNLMTAVMASLVISFFDETIKAYIPLAILMPIVASMGGNAGTQSLTVMVRQLALGDVDSSNAKKALRKEVIISLINGFFFASIVGVIAFLWFQNQMLGLVIGMALIINLFVAGFFGGLIPLILKKFKTDPAFGSSVVLTTLTDMIGFFSFLGLAKIML